MGRGTDLSIVIPAFNASQTLGAQLGALGAQVGAGAFEVIVADNGSTDRTRDVVEAYRDEVDGLRFVDASHRRGPAHARNVGASHARGELLLFCDADDVADAGWAAAMAAELGENDGVGGHLETSSLNPPKLHSARPSPTAGGHLPLAFGRWPVPIGASCGIHRARFDDLGGFDEAFPTAGGEETDLFIRLQLAGGSVAWAPDAVMHYRLRPGARAMWRQARTYGAANAVLRRRFRAEGVSDLDRRELLRDLPWMGKCVVLAPFSRRRRGELIWWGGHMVGLHTGRKVADDPSGRLPSVAAEKRVAPADGQAAVQDP